MRTPSDTPSRAERAATVSEREAGPSMSTPDPRPAPAMTLESLQGMTDDEINVLVAEKVMGYTLIRFDHPPNGWSGRHPRSGFWAWHVKYVAEGWEEARGDELRVENTPFCSDHTAAASVRAEIARRGLGPQFARALSGIVKPFDDDLDVQSISSPKAPTLWIPAWKMSNASPRDTALAALLTVHAEPSNG